jgi:hypothetical protein
MRWPPRCRAGRGNGCPPGPRAQPAAVASVPRSGSPCLPAILGR